MVALVCSLGLVAGFSSSAFSANAFVLAGGDTNPALLDRLSQAYDGRFADRTRYRHANGQPVYINRLILEPSPYLRQHAHTPVDWHAWGPDALALARQTNRPIFLSIGYATCHWCHVMEEESFDNEAIAALINANFVAIKVDREQHPNIDLLYMTALQITSETAGWPLTAVLLPSGEPFFIASYLPPDVLTRVLDESRRLWQHQPKELENFARGLSQAVQGFMALEGEARRLTLTDSLNAASARLLDLDQKFGGLARAPKFPNETSLAWLMDLLELAPSHPGLAEALRLTLEGMQAGGIHDQVGGGFHRYAVDRAWRVPHFEKMLYNQAQLLALYARAAVLYKDPSFRRTAERLVAFVLRDMRASDGLFYAGFDADSPVSHDAGANKEEGLYYLWQAAEIQALLGDEGRALAARLDIDDDFPLLGQASTAALKGPFDPALDRQLERLRQARALRPQPFLDTKRITAWNAQMVEGLARAARLLEIEAWQQAAVRAGDRLWALHFVENGAGLARFSMDTGGVGGDRAHTAGGLQDHAFAILAYLSLHDLTNQPRFFDRAQRLAALMTEQFWQPERSLFIGQGPPQAALFATPIDTMDSSQPSDSSAAVLAMAELAQRSNDRQTQTLAKQALAGLLGRIGENPEAHATAWRAALRVWQPNAGFAGFGVADGGVVRARLRPAIQEQRPMAELDIQLAEGWHINALEPLQSELIATQLTWQGQDSAEASLTIVEQPQASLRPVTYFDDPVAEYHDALRFAFIMPDTPGDLTLVFQACNDQICLAPQRLTFAVAR